MFVHPTSSCSIVWTPDDERVAAFPTGVTPDATFLTGFAEFWARVLCWWVIIAFAQQNVFHLTWIRLWKRLLFLWKQWLLDPNPIYCLLPPPRPTPRFIPPNYPRGPHAFNQNRGPFLGLKAIIGGEPPSLFVPC